MKKYVRSSPVLAEILVCILFLALSMSICVGLFADAYNINRRATNEQDALTKAQDIAERYLMSDLSAEAFLSENAEQVTNEASWVTSLQNCRLSFVICNLEGLDGFTISGYDMDNALFSFPVVKLREEVPQV